MNDYIIRGMAAGNEIRFVAAYTKGVVEWARDFHDTSPVCTAALGRLLTGGALMGAMCKNDTDVLTLKIQGNGPCGSITVTADAMANVKGLIGNPHVDLPLKSNGHLDVGGAVGRGFLTVIRDDGAPEPYVGQTALASGEIGEDLTYYFAESEQIPTSVGVGVLVDKDRTVKHAGGFIIQLLPFASEETVSKLEKSLAEFTSVTDAYSRGLSVEDMIRELVGEKVFGIDINIENPLETAYKCNCSRERVTKALIALGRGELTSMINDGKPVNLHCDFCNSDYEFTVEELEVLLAESSKRYTQ